MNPQNSNNQETPSKEEYEIESVFSISSREIEEMRSQAREEALRRVHEWRQKGAYILCTSCEYEHGFYIGTLKVMTGIDEKGLPIVKSKGK